jgi:predicted DNA-binding transcriptional regulator AlpA
VVLCEHIAEPHFDTRETAELLGLERRTIDQWIARKKLPVRLIEGKNYIRLVDLERILYEGSASSKREKNRRLKESAKLKKYLASRPHQKLKTTSNSSHNKST